MEREEREEEEEEDLFVRHSCTEQRKHQRRGAADRNACARHGVPPFLVSLLSPVIMRVKKSCQYSVTKKVSRHGPSPRPTSEKILMRT